MDASAEPVGRAIQASDGARLVAYDYGGAASARDCLLLHGNGMCARAYERLILSLRAAGLRVVALDARGCGASAPPPGADLDLRWARGAQDALEACAALGLGPALLGVGHSLGGCTLLLAASASPQLFSALFLYEPIVIPAAGKSEAQLDAGSAPLVAQARRRRASFPSRADALRLYASKPPFSLFHPACLADYVQHGLAAQPDGSVALCCSPQVEAEIFRQGAFSGAELLVPSLALPITVAVGGAGWHGAREAPAAYGERVAREARRGRLRVFDSLDHNGLLCDPDRVAVAILASFATVSRL